MLAQGAKYQKRESSQTMRQAEKIHSKHQPRPSSIAPNTWLQGLPKSSTFLFSTFSEKFFREVILAGILYNHWKFHPDWSSHLWDH